MVTWSPTNSLAVQVFIGGEFESRSVHNMTRLVDEVGAPANHFPTPGIGAGLMLAPSGRNVIAFRTFATGAITSAAQGGRPAISGGVIAEIVLACLAAIGAFGWLAWLVRRRRRT